MWRIIGLTLVACVLVSGTLEAGEKKEVGPVLTYTMKNIDGKDVNLADYEGNVLLIVNVASQCGLTPQYEGMENLYRRYKDKGLKILAFPANNFGQQEPGTDPEIKEFCSKNYDVTFNLFSKVSVKGEDTCDLYKFLTDGSKNGGFDGEIKWNFQKYLVDRKGNVIAKFEPKTPPLDKSVVEAVEKALEQPKE